MSKANPFLQRASVLIDAGQHAQAEAQLQRALAADRRSVAVNALMTLVLSEQKRYVQAEYFAKAACALQPGDAQLLHNHGQMLVYLGKYAEAEGPLTQAVQLMPQSLGTRALLGFVLVGLWKYATACAVLRPGLEAGDPDMVNTYCHALHSMGRVEESAPLLRAAVQREPNVLGRVQHFAAMLNYAPGIDPAELFNAHREFGRVMELHAGPPPAWDRGAVAARKRDDLRVRVGLISPDLRDHAVGYLIEAFPEHADRSRVFVACYSNASREDARSQEIKGKADLWRSVQGLDSAASAALIRQDHIDVLIDLAGHTNGHRLDVMAHKPAPVQMTYMGYPNCTGLRAVDYRLVDTLSEPEGCDAYSVETLLRMDPCFLSYRWPRNLPDVGPLPMSLPGATGPTFAAFSALIKLNTPLLQMWARVLKELPGSTMILKHFGLKGVEVRDDVKARFAAAGIDPARILAEPPEASAQQILPLYNRVDICLDTFPYNGTTTICEACLMGVPVVSLAGDTPASRVSRSILAAIGTPELCASTEDEFVRIAVDLARDARRLGRLRGELRSMFMRCPIGDAKAFAGRYTDAACQAFAAWLEGRTITRVE